MVYYAQNARPRAISKEEMLADFDEAKRIFSRYIVQHWNAPAESRTFTRNIAITAIDAFEARATLTPGKELARTLRAMM